MSTSDNVLKLKSSEKVAMKSLKAVAELEDDSKPAEVRVEELKIQLEGAKTREKESEEQIRLLQEEMGLGTPRSKRKSKK